MMTSPFDHILDMVEGASEPLGYRRLRSRFVRDVDDASIEVSYQKSRASGPVKFTVDLSLTLIPLIGAGTRLLHHRRLRGVEPHWTERLGFLLPVNDDVWWEVSVESASEVGNLHAHLFKDVINPTLESRATVSWHVSEWRAGRARWLAEDQWRGYLRRAEELG